MAYLKFQDRDFRRIVEQYSGVGKDIANALGVTPQAVSLRLNSETHFDWWQEYKKSLSVNDVEFRRIVEECDGVGLRVAERLGITPQAVSRRLHGEKHFAWWMNYKKTRAQRQAAAQGVEETIASTNAKLRALVEKHQGNLGAVAAEMGLNEASGVPFVKEYLENDQNRAWWDAFQSRLHTPEPDNELEIQLLKNRVAYLEAELQIYKSASA